MRAANGITGRVTDSLRDWFSGHWDYLVAAAAFVNLTILFTWPLAANFATFVNGNVYDVFHEMWYLHLDYSAPLGPFFLLWTHTILYPYGVPMYFQVLSPLNAIIGAPIYQFAGLVETYNFLYMFSFFGSALSMYFLVRYLTSNRYAAFIAGIAFAFAPIHLAQATAHLNVISSSLLPIFPYFLLKMTREESDRNGVYAGIIVALNAMFDLHFLLDCMVITAGMMIYFLILKRKTVLNKPFAIRFVLMVVTAGLIGIVVYFQTFYGLVIAPSSQGFAAATTLPGVHTQRSADIVQFFLPPASNPIVGAYTFPTYQNLLTATDVQTYIGYTVLGLAIAGLVAKRRDREVFVWAFLAIVAFLLALGPYVQVNGQVTNLEGIWGYLYYLIPLFRAFRTPYRLDFVVALSLAILAGYGSAAILSRIGGRPRWRITGGLLRPTVAIILCILIAFEFITIPFAEMNAQIPPGYSKILGPDTSSYSVLDVPSFVGNDVYLYYQTVYGQPTITGHVSRTPPSSLIFVQGAPFITQFGVPARKGPVPYTDILNQTLNLNLLGPYILSQFNIKYVIVHKDLLPPAQYSTFISTLSTVLGFPLYNDSLTTIYRVPVSPNLGLAQYPKAGGVQWVGLLSGAWNPFGLFGGHTRAMAESGSVFVFSQAAGYYQVEFNAEGASGDYHVSLGVNGQRVGTYLMVNGTYATYTSPFVRLNQGANEIDFVSNEGCVTLTTAANTAVPLAATCASVQFQWIDLIPAAAP
jgi:hypothetical protein